MMTVSNGFAGHSHSFGLGGHSHNFGLGSYGLGFSFAEMPWLKIAAAGVAVGAVYYFFGRKRKRGLSGLGRHRRRRR